MSTPRQTLSYLRQRFQDVGIEPEKKHGQNFLIDLNLMDLLASTANLQPNDVILEVGTGTGALTGTIAPQVAHVITVEIDTRMHQIASEELIDLDNVTMLRQDALANKNHLSPKIYEELNKHLQAEPGRQLKLVANLPYCVATPVISNLLAHAPLPASMTVTIQKELAERIISPPGKKNYNALSLWIQSQCQCELVRVMAPSVFWPRPQVDSAILHIVHQPERRNEIGDVAFFHEFVRSLFLYRRKFLRSVLLTVLKGKLDKNVVDEIMAELNFEGNVRADELPVEKHIALARAVQARL